MRLEQDEFTASLKGKIVEAERKFEKLCTLLNQKFQPIASSRQMECQLQMSRTGHDSFVPYYCSEITMVMIKKDVAVDNHRILIWECRREFLGFPCKWNIPGSKQVGEFIDESYEHVAKKLEEHAESYLNETI